MRVFLCLAIAATQLIAAASFSNVTVPRGVLYPNETDLAEKLLQNEALLQDYKVNGSKSNSVCNADMTHKMPACYQVCDEWCWATSITMVDDYYKGENNCVGAECAVAEHEFGLQCCPWTNSCHNKYNEQGSACNKGGTTPQMQAAVSYFTGGDFTTSGPLSQQDLDTSLNSGRVIMINVHWSRGGGHSLLVGGCGNGYYYLHDPWGWYSDMGYPQPAAWQDLTYSQLLEYPSPTALGKWADTIMWSSGDSEKHEETLRKADLKREMNAQTSPVASVVV
jgi:hypothetical protein